MSLPDYKALKKLADTCRKLGIKHFKNAEFEFTLSEEAPVSNYKKRQAEQLPNDISTEDTASVDTLTDDQMLFWSSADILSGEQ